MAERILLNDMNSGETGIVGEILGGRGVHAKLRTLGIQPGVMLMKVSAHFAGGPVVVQVGGTQGALGFGVSTKVIMEVNRR